MTNEEAIKHLTAKLECLTRSKGFREKCDSYNSYEGCYECDLGYKQGNIGEQIESLKMAIKALEQEPILDKIRAEIEALIEWHDCPIEYDNGNDAWYCEACNQAIKIIDKYKAESEKE